jgi:hypothetical protein
MGKAKSFIVPGRMNINAATMQSTLNSCGATAGHFAIRSGAVIICSYFFIAIYISAETLSS